MALPEAGDHAGVRTALRDLLARHAEPAGQPAADPRGRWRSLADLGLFALPVPAEHDGLGLGLAASAVAYEELGRALAWGPLVWTQLAVLARPGLADGSAIVTGADLTVVPDGDPVLVEHLAAADALLVLDGEGVRLCARADAEYEALPRSLDPGTPMARLHAPPRGERLGDAACAEGLRRAGVLLTAAYLLGLADRAVAVAVEHARRREQFGRPIGSFQAVKHLLADAHVRVALARAALAAAAEIETARPGAGAQDLAAAHLLAARAADTGARTAVQVLGGMGFTWETEPHLLLKRARAVATAFGDPDRHAFDLADGLVGPAGPPPGRGPAHEGRAEAAGAIA